MSNSGFPCGAILNCTDTTRKYWQSQYYWQCSRIPRKSLYKQNELVCGRCTCISWNISNVAAVLRSTQPYSSKTYHVWWFFNMKQSILGGRGVIWCVVKLQAPHGFWVTLEVRTKCHNGMRQLCMFGPAACQSLNQKRKISDNRAFVSYTVCRMFIYAL